MSRHSKEKARAELQKRQYDDGAEVIEQLASLLRQNPNLQSVISYEPLAKWHEVDVTSLPEKLPEIHFDMVENVENAPFPTKKYDAVIVPVFGFNEHGYRLGHGSGWYDKFLATQPQALKIGVGYENTLVDFEPEPHDVRMDIVITEKNCRDFR